VNLESARAINDQGQVVGTTALGHRDDISVHGFFWGDLRYTDLGAFAPQAIDDHGQAVSAVSGGASPYPCAATWRDGQTIRLPSLNSVRNVANGVNARGQIVGSGDRPVFGPRSAGPAPARSTRRAASAWT
jgi:probable HAF family extracellular repeat protein